MLVGLSNEGRRESPTSWWLECSMDIEGGKALSSKGRKMAFERGLCVLNGQLEERGPNETWGRKKFEGATCRLAFGLASCYAL